MNDTHDARDSRDWKTIINRAAVELDALVVPLVDQYRAWLTETADHIVSTSQKDMAGKSKDLVTGIAVAKRASAAVSRLADTSPWARLGVLMLAVSPEAARAFVPAAGKADAIDNLSYSGQGWRDTQVAYTIVRQDLETELFASLSRAQTAQFNAVIAEVATTLVADAAAEAESDSDPKPN